MFPIWANSRSEETFHAFCDRNRPQKAAPIRASDDILEDVSKMMEGF